jgi:hypothetical protein
MVRTKPAASAVAVSVALCPFLLIAACAYDADYAAKRREGLLSVYPPGTLTQADVHSRFKGRAPTGSFTRPVGGWAASTSQLVGGRSLESELRTGKQVQTVEIYQTPDGMFSLCYLWFYYDADNRLTDTDWQWSSD